MRTTVLALSTPNGNERCAIAVPLGDSALSPSPMALPTPSPTPEPGTFGALPAIALDEDDLEPGETASRAHDAETGV